jgi:hypothetical protein
MDAAPLCRQAVALAMEHAEKFAPGTDGVAVLICQDAADLVQVREVMRGPCGEKLGERNGAEGGMMAATAKIGRLEMKSTQLSQFFRALAGKLIEKLCQKLILAAAAFAVEGLEGACIAMLQDVTGAGNPVDAVGVDEMRKNRADVPGTLALVVIGPDGWQAAQERIKSGGRAGEKSNRVVNVKLRHFPSIATTA